MLFEHVQIFKRRKNLGFRCALTFEEISIWTEGSRRKKCWDMGSVGDHSKSCSAKSRDGEIRVLDRKATSPKSKPHLECRRRQQKALETG